MLIDGWRIVCQLLNKNVKPRDYIAIVDGE